MLCGIYSIFLPADLTVARDKIKKNVVDGFGQCLGGYPLLNYAKFFIILQSKNILTLTIS